jgi:hypothetical protein
VFGGAFDEEFQTASRTFFDRVRSGRFKLVTSALLQDEIKPAPKQVRDLFDGLLEIFDVVEISKEALNLKDAYLETGIVTEQSADDALHVAIASVNGCRSSLAGTSSASFISRRFPCITRSTHSRVMEPSGYSPLWR